MTKAASQTRDAKLVVTKPERDRRLEELQAKPAAAKTANELLEEILLRQARIEQHLGIK